MDKVDLHSSSREEFMQDVIAEVKGDLTKGYSLEGLLEYLFDKAYLKGEVDHRQFIDKIREKMSNH
jgi:hypothetical protein